MILNNFLVFFNSKLLPFLLSIVGFGLLIVIHELGHFLFCKLFGIHTPTFSVGFGPSLYEKKIGNTNFKLSKIPFGGYVEIAGLAEVGQGEQAHANDTGHDSFSSKAYWKKVLVLSGGIIFNLIFAYLVFCTLFIIGDSSNKPGILVTNIVKESSAEKFGLKAGDQILAINSKSTTVSENLTPLDARSILLKEIEAHPNQAINLEIERENKVLNLSITLGSKAQQETAIGSLGAGFNSPIQKLPLLDAISMGITVTNKWICDIAKSLKTLFTGGNLEGAGGPVMIIAHGFKTAQSGLIPLFLFLAIMSINLALFNLLPLGITDGGQLVFATIEAIIRRPTPEFIRIAVNLVSFGIFILLFFYLTYKDISSLFGTLFVDIYNKMIGLFQK